MGHDGFQHFIHHRLGLAHGQAADAVAEEVHIPQGLGAFDAQILEERALHNAEQHLIVVGMVLLATLGPAVSAMHRILGGGVVAGIGGADVKGHHDIAAQRMLDIHADLRGDKAVAAVQMALEGHAFFLDLADAGKGKHLKPAAVGQDGLGPRHELVQAARLADQVFAGAKVQVIGVGEHDLRADLQHLPGGHGLDGGHGAHGHIHGRVDVAVGRVQQAQPRAGLLAGLEDFKRKLGCCH